MKLLNNTNAREAEEEAIRTARALHPGIPVCNDNAIACGREGAYWIPRKMNKVADRLVREAKRRVEQGILLEAA